MPANAVYVGRPTKWGNPYRVVEIEKDIYNVIRVGKGTQLMVAWAIPKEMALKLALQGYREWIENINVDELRGKNLACFCSLSSPCHADILLERCR